MKFELKKLLLEHRFGSIRLGDSAQKVVRLLGFPKEYHFEDRSLKISRMLKQAHSLEQFAFRYGSIEFWFSFGDLYFLYSDHFGQDLEFRSERYFDPWILKRGLCLKEFLLELLNNKIQFSIFQSNLVHKEDGAAFQIYFSDQSYVIFSSEPRMIWRSTKNGSSTEIISRPCPEICGFYLSNDRSRPDGLPYLRKVLNFEELIS